MLFTTLRRTGMKKLTPLQIEKRSAEEADFRMTRLEMRSALNRVFAIGLLIGAIFLFAFGCLIGRQADRQWAEIPYIVESPSLPSQVVEREDPQLYIKRYERTQFVLNEMDRLWSAPLQ